MEQLISWDSWKNLKESNARKRAVTAALNGTGVPLPGSYAACPSTNVRAMKSAKKTGLVKKDNTLEEDKKPDYSFDNWLKKIEDLKIDIQKDLQQADSQEKELDKKSKEKDSKEPKLNKKVDSKEKVDSEEKELNKNDEDKSSPEEQKKKLDKKPEEKAISKKPELNKKDKVNSKELKSNVANFKSDKKET